ncbi:MAG: flippase-like domain-containing protein [Eubacterium sp.]|nr:flippase-like domain-containing protein [Eubacterium sp.]
MKKPGKSVLNIVFLAAILALTFVSLLRGESIPDLIRGMRAADGRFLLLAVLFVLLFLAGQALVIYLMLRALHIRCSLWKCMLFSFTGYFFCNITPFQSGGPPAQIISMRKEGIPVPIASIVILVMTFLFKLVLVVIGILYLIFGQRLIHAYLLDVLPVFGVGLFLTIGFSYLLAMFIFYTPLSSKAALIFLDWLEEKHIFKHKEGRRESWIAFLERYGQTSGFFRNHKLLLIILFAITVVQRFMLFLVTYFVYRAFRLSGTSAWTISVLQSAISIAADMLPLPGGAGASEAVFVRVFRPIFGSGKILPGMLLSRGISYYVQLIFCGIMTVVSKFVIGRGRDAQAEVAESRKVRHTDEQAKLSKASG